VAYHVPPKEDTFPGGTVSYIELDDMGVLFNDEQLRAVIDIINVQNQRSPDGTLVVTYVHGWNHSSDPSDENVTNFREQILMPIAMQEQQAAQTCGSRRPVVGIYVGWRGKLFTPHVPGIFVASYFNRNSAATRVGGTSGSEVLTAISRATRRWPNARSVLIGHSMGGLITEASVIPALQDSIEEQAVKASSQQTPEQALEKPAVARFSLRGASPTDLVILINPASPALAAAKFDEMLNRWRVKVETKAVSPYDREINKAPPSWHAWQPLIVSLTSVGDTNTGRDFVLGNTISAMPKRFRWSDDASRYGEQWDLARHTAGHWDPLFTHSILYESDAKKDDGRDAKKENEKDTVAFDSIGRCDVWSPSVTPQERAACVRVGTNRLTFVEGRREDPAKGEEPFPYWILPLPDSIVKNHTEFFNAKFVRVVEALLALTGGFRHKECTKELWGEAVPTAKVRAQLPASCDAPPPNLKAKTYCMGGAACTVGDAIVIKILQSNEKEYSPQLCDAITWSLGRGVAMDTNQSSYSVNAADAQPDDDGIVRGVVVISNHLARRLVPFETKLVPPLRVPITYSGPCVSESSQPCPADETVNFRAEVPSSVAASQFVWKIDGKEVKSDVPALSHTFASLGDTSVSVRFRVPGTAGIGERPLTVVPAPCVAPAARPEVNVISHATSGGCSLGERECIGKDIVLSTSYTNTRSPGCYTFSWTVDGQPPTEGAEQREEFAPGEHEAVVSVTAKGVTKQSLPGKFKVCPAPPPVVISYRIGATPASTAEEPVDFSVAYRSGELLQGCETVEWSFADGQVFRTTSVRRIFPRPLEQQVVRVRVMNSGGSAEDLAVFPLPDRERTSLAAVAIRIDCLADGCRAMSDISFSLENYQPDPQDRVVWQFDDGTARSGAAVTKHFSAGTHRLDVKVDRDELVQHSTATVMICASPDTSPHRCHHRHRTRVRHRRFKKASLDGAKKEVAQ
jgi:hypothetical protein